MLEFRILGPLEVRADGEVLALPASKQRALPTLLLLNANKVVAREQLIDSLWAERPAATAANAVQVHVSQKLGLRGQLLLDRMGYKRSAFLGRLQG